MKKEFDTWNSLKKTIENTDRQVFGYPREVWWCSLGINIGAESDGKNENFERPVIIVRVYNKETMLVLPITSREKIDPFHASIIIDAVNKETGKHLKKIVYIKLTQARVISNKRLLRKVDVIAEREFETIKNKLKDFT